MNASSWFNFAAGTDTLLYIT